MGPAPAERLTLVTKQNSNTSRMNPMARLSHIGLTVKNLERSLAFYRDVAGMNERAVPEGENRASGTPFTENARMKMVHVITGTFRASAH